MTLAQITSYVYKRTGTKAADWGASLADLVIMANTAADHVHSLIRSRIDNFRPTAWTTSDFSTGTATPVFDSMFHELIPLWISAMYSADKNLKKHKALMTEIAPKERELLMFYGSRNYRPFTITIAAPGVITAPNHKLRAGDRVTFMTTGALPTGLSVDTWYYVVSTSLATDTFTVSATKDGTAITTTGSQSGTHYYATDRQTHSRMRPVADDCH